MTDLKKILGVGKVKAEKIKEAGYADVEALAALTDEALAEKPLSLKPESIASIRELVGNESASPQEEESTGQESASAEDSVEGQDQTSTPSEDGSEPEADNPESSPAEQPQESDANSQASDPESEELAPAQVIEFRLTSGKHKNRVLTWNTANPSAQFKDGLYVSLSVLTVAKRAEQPVEGETAFNLVYGQTTNGASLPDAEFKAFMEALAKKQPRHQQTRLG